VRGSAAQIFIGACLVIVGTLMLFVVILSCGYLWWEWLVFMVQLAGTALCCDGAWWWWHKESPGSEVSSQD
jgi:hypothetical protein